MLAGLRRVAGHCDRWDGIYLTDHHTGSGDGAYWDGVASIVIGLVLAIVAFVLARTSRGLLLGEAANRKSVVAIKEALKGIRM